MRDLFLMKRNGITYHARRFLRESGGAFYQSLFYEGEVRCDPSAYPSFSIDEPAMQAAASLMLAEMIDRPAPAHP